MTEKEKLDLVKDISRIQIEVMQRFHSLISEQVVRKGLSVEDIEHFRESIIYVLDEKLSFVENKIKD